MTFQQKLEQLKSLLSVIHGEILEPISITMNSANYLVHIPTRKDAITNDIEAIIDQAIASLKADIAKQIESTQEKLARLHKLAAEYQQ